MMKPSFSCSATLASLGSAIAGDRGDEALPLEKVQMRSEQLAANAAALRIGGQINTGLDAPTVSRAVAHGDVDA